MGDFAVNLGAGSGADSGAPASSGAPSGADTSTSTTSTATSTPSAPTSLYDNIMGVLGDDSDSSSDTPENVDSSEGENANIESEEGQSEETDASKASAKDADGGKKGDEPSSEWDEEVGPPEVTKGEDGKNVYSWPKPRAERIYAGYKAAQQYQEIAPTVEEAREHRDGFILVSAISEDFSSATPERVEKVLGHLQKTSPEGMTVAAKVLAEKLPDANPQAYTAMRDVVLQRSADDLYSRARDAAKRLGNESEEAQTYLFAAQNLDFLLTGTHRTLEAATKEEPTQVDQRIAEVERREQALREQENQRAQAATTEWANTPNAKIKASVTGILTDAVKEPLKALKEHAPEVYERAVRELKSEVRKEIDSDRAWNEIWKARHAQALRSRTEDDVKDLQNRMSSRVRLALRKALPQITKVYGQNFVAKSEQTTDKFKKASSRKDLGGSPSGGNSPAVNPQYDAALKSKDTRGAVEALLGVK